MTVGTKEHLHQLCLHWGEMHQLVMLVEERGSRCRIGEFAVKRQWIADFDSAFFLI